MCRSFQSAGSNLNPYGREAALLAGMPSDAGSALRLALN